MRNKSHVKREYRVPRKRGKYNDRIHDRQLPTHLLVACDLEKHARNYPCPRLRSLVVVASRAPEKEESGLIRSIELSARKPGKREARDPTRLYRRENYCKPRTEEEEAVIRYRCLIVTIARLYLRTHSYI